MRRGERTRVDYPTKFCYSINIDTKVPPLPSIFPI